MAVYTWHHVSLSLHLYRTCGKYTWSLSGKCKPYNLVEQHSSYFTLPSDQFCLLGLCQQMIKLQCQKWRMFHRKICPLKTFGLNKQVDLIYQTIQEFIKYNLLIFTTDIEETQQLTEEILEGPEIVIFKVYIQIINHHFLFLSPLRISKIHIY